MGPAFHYQAFAMMAIACAVFLWPLYLLNRHQPAMRPWLWASLCLPMGPMLLPLQLQGDIWWGVTFANHCLLLWNTFTVTGLLLYCGWNEGRVWRLMITLFLLISLPFNYFTWVDFDTRARILIFSLMYILLYSTGATVLWLRFGLRTGRYGVNLLFAMCSLMAVIMMFRVPVVLFDVSFDSILDGRLINLIVSSVGYFVAYGLVLSFALLLQEDRQLELQLLQQQAQHNAAVKSHFLATLSHELRTPLNAITGIAEKLQNDCHDAMQKQDCSLIIDQAMGLSKLARDVLMQSEQEHSEISRPQQAVMLNHWLRCLIAGLQPVVQRPNVLLELICHTDLGCRQIDSVRLRQTLTNLIGNAIKYTQQGSIRLQVTAVDEGRIRFDVEDTGCGLAAEDIPRLLQPFTRADSAREQEGSGLGLSLAQQWLRQMGSQLDCVSWPGVGSRFGFTLALEPADVQLEDPVSVENSSVDIALSVLVVEDVLLNRELVVNQLRQLGHWVASVASLAEARLHRQQHHVDVILLDMNLPDGDGLSLLPWLKQQQLDSKVIAFTADSSPRRLQQLQQSGLDGVVNKPVTQNMLKAALQPLQLAVADPIIDRLELSQTRRHIPEVQWPQQLEQALQRLQQETPISVDDVQWRATVHRIASQSSSLGLQRLRLLALELLDQTEQIESYQCVRLQQLLLFSIECLKEQSHAGIRNTDTLTVAGG